MARAEMEKHVYGKSARKISNERREETEQKSHTDTKTIDTRDGWCRGGDGMRVRPKHTSDYGSALR